MPQKPEENTYQICHESEMLQAKIVARVQLSPLIARVSTQAGAPHEVVAILGIVVSNRRGWRVNMIEEGVGPAGAVTLPVRGRYWRQFHADSSVAIQVSHCEERQAVRDGAE